MQLPASAIRTGEVIAVDVAGEEYVLWRGRDGRVRSAPRRCPHLDHDLAEGHVDADELVCPGHGWAFNGDGNTFKRNEFGRVDPKGSVARLAIHEAEEMIGLE